MKKDQSVLVSFFLTMENIEAGSGFCAFGFCVGTPSYRHTVAVLLPIFSSSQLLSSHRPTVTQWQPLPTE